MDLKRFEETVKKLDRNKYHVGRSIRFDENCKPYIDEWNIFRKDMSVEEYFSPENLAILSSKNNNTIEDIEQLIKEEQNDNT